MNTKSLVESVLYEGFMTSDSEHLARAKSLKDDLDAFKSDKDSHGIEKTIERAKDARLKIEQERGRLQNALKNLDEADKILDSIK